MRVVLDTNVLGSALIEGDPSREAALGLLSALDGEGHEVYLPTVVVAELGVAFLQADATAEWAAFLAVLRQGRRYRTISLDLDVADAAAHLRARSRLKLPDAVVAAAAASVDADLLVSDDPDLRRLGGAVPVRTVRRALAAIRAA
ncbi:MAG TPA: PIN domain-containing protein [Thermoplasmata archaeon]|nr:PIN domain-containing protein [Thermoplasmata archaeon]